MNKQIEYYENKLSYEMDSSDLYEAIKLKENITIIDARKESAFDVEHIPGAINIPHREMNHETTKTLNKDSLYVVYCDGIGCNASTKGALNMTKLGFRVKELIGGIERWKFDRYPTEGSKQNILDGSIECGC